MTVFTVPPTPESETTQAPDAVVRIYNAPTCTLEISANSSPLSRWTQKPTLKNQRFKLQFDDPRLGEEQWLVLRGDRIKLEALTDAVASYVQTFLTRSNTLSIPDTETELTDAVIPEIAGTPQGITLQPKGLLAHTLSLGTLASETTGPDLTLTSTQLADLASVLDEHSAETIALPVLTRNFAWTRSPAVWGKIAAGTLLSVGLTATVLNQFGKPTPPQIATTSASSNDQRTAPVPLPSPSASSPLLTPGASIPPGSITVPPPVNNGGAIASNPDPATSGAAPPGTTQGGTSGSATSDAPAASSPASPGTKTSPTLQNIPTQDIPQAATKPEPAAKRVPPSVSGYPVAAIPRTDASRENSRTSADLNPSEDPSPPAIDRSVQIGEIQDRVKSQWKPTEKPAEDLTYVMEVDGTGKVISVEPQGDLAKKSVAALPGPGASIASPLPAGTKAYKVQLVLSTDGSVKAFILP